MAGDRAADLAAALDNARAKEAVGDVAAAVAAYRALLGRWPDCAPAWFHLGAVLHASGHPDDAIAAWFEAIRFAPDLAEAHLNLSIALLAAGQAPAALAAARTALRLRPGWPPARCRIGSALAALGRREEAAALYRDVLADQPDHAEAAFLLGQVQSELGDHAGAAAAFDMAARLPGFTLAQLRQGEALLAAGEPEAARDALSKIGRAVSLPREWHGRFHLAAGNALTALGQREAAVARYRDALAAAPDQVEASANLCAVLQEVGDLDGAIAAGEAALRQAPGFAEAAANLGNAKLTIGDFAGAERAYRQALARRADFPAAWSNLGAALRDQGRLAEAELACRAALELAPRSAAAHYNLALVLLTAGRYREGWAEHEWRWRTGTMKARDFPCPPWRGEALAGRRILLHAEQGLGDTLQFVRYVPVIAAMGAEVVLEVQAPLKRLLAGISGVAAIHARGETLPCCDYHAPLMSLPHRLGTEIATIPARPYLPRPEPVPPEPARAAADGLRVGLVWAGDPRPGEPRAHFADRRRSLPLAAFAPFAAIPGIRFVSLQKGAAAAETPPPGLELEAALAAARDFADTAAVVMGLDLVISVDTSVAHLAAGLGKPVWLLSRYDQCWRWLAGREDSPWYPTLRLHRQAAPGEWQPLIGRMTAALAALAAAPRHGESAARTDLVPQPVLV